MLSVLVVAALFLGYEVRSTASLQEARITAGSNSGKSPWSAKRVVSDNNDGSTKSQWQSNQVVVNSRSLFSESTWWENEGCPTECAIGEFCGKDMQCHAFHCDAIYQYGNPQGTYVTDDSEELTCVNFEAGEPDREFLSYRRISFCDDTLPIGIRFGCGAVSECDLPLETSETCSYVTMNRKCFARQSDSRYFVCYDISPTTNMDEYFADYISATVNLENNTAYNFSHIYRAKSIRVGENLTNSGDMFHGSTSFFDQRIASSVMNVIVDIASPTAFPSCVDVGCLVDEFCGADLKCHKFTCQNFYDFAPPEYAGVKQNSGKAAELTCHELDIVADNSQLDSTNCSLPGLLQYKCVLPQAYALTGDLICNGQSLNITKQYVYFNEICSAKPNDVQTFFCYGVAPETDLSSYFSDYVDFFSNYTCPMNKDGDQLVGRHDFGLVVRNRTHTDYTLGEGGLVDNFDPEVARYIINTLLLGDPPDSSAGTMKLFLANSLIFVASAVLLAHSYS